MEDFSINTAVKPYWGDSQHKEQVNATLSPFSKDSIASAEPREGSKKREISGQDEEPNKSPSFKERIKATINWLYSFVYSNEMTSTNANAKVQDILEIKNDRHAKAKQQFIDDMIKLHQHIAEQGDEFKVLLKDGHLHTHDALILKLLVQSIKNQIGQREDQSLLALSKVDTLQKHTANLRTTETKIQERLEGLNNRHNIASKMETASMVVAGAIAVATLTVAGAAVAGGAGAYLTTAQIVQGVFAYSAAKTGAVVGAMQGGTTLFSGYTKGKANEQIQEAKLVDAQKDLAKDSIHVEMDLLKKGTQDITQMYAMLRKHAEQQKDASSSMFSR